MFKAPKVWIVLLVVIFNWLNCDDVKPSNNTLKLWISESEIDDKVGYALYLLIKIKNYFKKMNAI